MAATRPIEIPALQDKLKAWEDHKAFWLAKTGTTFGRFNNEHYKKVLEAKQNLSNCQKK